MPIRKASPRSPFTFSYPKTNQTQFVLSPGASSQVACSGGSRTVSGVPQLGSTACPKNTLSPPERLCKHRGFEASASVGARYRHVGRRSRSHQLQRAGVLFIFMHVDATQMLAEGTDAGEQLRARSGGSGRRAVLPGVNRVTARCGRVLLLNLKPGCIR